ncbi:MAG: hypothetical protein AAF840_15835, partial [Bacteroidota bacterium]
KKIDSTGRINLSASYAQNGSDNSNSAATQIFSANTLLDDYSVDQMNDSNTPQIKVAGNYNRRLKKKGRSLRLYINGDYSTTDVNSRIITEGLSENLDLPGTLINGLQQQLQANEDRTANAGFNFTEPLSKKWRLGLLASYNHDEAEGNFSYEHENEIVRNVLTRTWSGTRLGTRLIHPFGKGNNFSMGVDYHHRELSLEGDETRQEPYRYWLPFARLRLRTGKSWINFRYNTSRQAPSLGQLQSIAIPGSTGRVAVGNPSLQPTYQHRLSGNFWMNDEFRGLSFYTSANASYTDQAFGNAVTLTQGQQIYQTVNVSHAWSQSANLGSNISLNFIKGQLQLNGNYNRTVGQGLVNTISRTNINNNLTASATLTTEFNEKSFLSLGYTWSRGKNFFQNDEAPAILTIRNQLSTRLELEFTRLIRLESRFTYSLFETSAFGGDNTVSDLMVAMEIRLFKTKEHFFRLFNRQLSLYFSRRANSKCQMPSPEIERSP